MSVFQCNFYSKYLANFVDVTVYIPSYHNGDISMGDISTDILYDKKQKFKTIYLLHGMLDDHSCWMRWSMVEEQAEKHKIALVMPSGQNSFYVNAEHGLAYYDFINDELPRWAEMNFPLLEGRENRFIAGLSMGGYGAIRHGLGTPEKYAAVGAFSGALDIVGLESVLKRVPGMRNIVDYDSIFGGADKIEGTDNDLFTLAESCKNSAKELPKIFITCGTEDAICYEMDVKYRDTLLEMGYDVTYFEMPGVHEWKVWNESIRQFMNLIDPENA
nr:alpha/beta hydrolase family protein [uncultured Blautia sp.]